MKLLEEWKHKLECCGGAPKQEGAPDFNGVVVSSWEGRKEGRRKGRKEGWMKGWKESRCEKGVTTTPRTTKPEPQPTCNIIAKDMVAGL